MNRISNWEEFRTRGGRQNRLRLSDDEWESKILALACEGNLLTQIQGIMTAGHDREIRIKWGIGEGTDPRWTKAQRDQVKSIIWEFLHDDIVSMYQRRIAPNGIVSTIKLRTGFVLPESTMLNQLRDWNVPIVGRGGGPSVARVTRPARINGRAASQIPVRTIVGADPSSPRQNAQSQTSLDMESQGHGIASTQQSTQPDVAFGSFRQSEPPELDASTSLERLVQQVEAYRNEVQTYKYQMEEQNRKHDLETKTQNENHERVLTMAKEHARMADETNAQLATLRWNMSQIQEDNTALRAEVTNLQNANKNLRTTISQQEFDSRRVKKQLSDLRENFGIMETNHTRLLRDFESLKHENLSLKNQKQEEQRVNLMLTQHIRNHATKLQNLLASPSNGIKIDDVQDLVNSLNNPAIQENRRTSRDSGFFSGGTTNSKHLSVGSQNRNTNPKRPRHEFLSSPMGRSISAQQHENPSVSHTAIAQRPLTEPRPFDMQSMIGRCEDQTMGPAAPVTTDDDVDFALFLNMSEDNTVRGAQGAGWGDASPTKAQTFAPLDNIDSLFQMPTGPFSTSSGPPGNFIFGSSR